MGSVCLNEYPAELCRLDSGGETTLQSTFLATTLGLRRLFVSVIFKAISVPKSLYFHYTRLFQDLIKSVLDSEYYTSDEKPFFTNQNCEVERQYSSAENLSTIAVFHAEFA